MFDLVFISENIILLGIGKLVAFKIENIDSGGYYDENPIYIGPLRKNQFNHDYFFSTELWD